MCDMTHSYVCHDSFICALRLIHECVTSYLDSFVRVRPLLSLKLMCAICMKRYLCEDGYVRSYMWVMTRLYVRHDSFMCAPWLIYTCAMTHLYDLCENAWVRDGLFVRAPWHIHTCAMTYSYVRHDPSMTHSNVWHDSITCVQSLTHMCDMTHSYVRHDPFIHVPPPKSTKSRNSTSSVQI